MWVMRAQFQDGDGTVHAFRVPEVDYGVLRSVCGLTADPAELDRVEAFTGAPCNGCALLASLGSECAPVAREIEPVYETDESGRFAIALHGDLETHLVGDSPLRRELNGRPVVLTLCARIAWGPLATPPPEWSVCSECADAAQVSA